MLKTPQRLKAVWRFIRRIFVVQFLFVLIQRRPVELRRSSD